MPGWTRCLPEASGTKIEETMNAKSDNGDCHSCSSATKARLSASANPVKNQAGLRAVRTMREGVASWA